MDVIGFSADDRVAAMIARINTLSPRRPLVFQEINPAHHAVAGAEIFPDALRVSLRVGAVDNLVLSHELGHVLIGLQHPHLAIGDQIRRGTVDRRMVGTLLSLFEHPAVFAIQREYGFDTYADAESKMQAYLDDFNTLPPEKPPNSYIEKIQGYVELHYLRPDDHRWPQIEVEFAKRAPRSCDQAHQVLSTVVTPERVERHAYKEMLDAFIVAVDLRTAYWPPLVELRPAARSDVAA